jgi:SGNH domain (fused to AT3 domains)
MVAVIGGQAWRTNGFPMRYNGALEAMAGEPEAGGRKMSKAARKEAEKKARKEAEKARTALLTYSYDILGNALRDECWFSRQARNTAFAACLPQASPSKQRILIWGDSHAARLYAGAKLDADLQVGLTALDICPPALKGVDGACLQSNQYVLSLIKKDPPDVVILFAAWYGAPQGKHVFQGVEASVQGVVEVTKEIRKAGVGRVIVAGPAPYWAADLPKVVFKHWTRLSPPRRLNVGLEPDAFEVDRLMRQQSWPRGVEYFSMTDVLCDDDGCLTYVPGSGELTSYDYGHLTIPAAAFVAQKMIHPNSEDTASIPSTKEER